MSIRKFSRVNFQVDATVIAEGHQFHGEVDNLSMSGMFMATKEQLQLGEPVNISINLSGMFPEINVNITGTTSRIDENGIGFNFEKIDLDSYTHLKNIVAYNTGDVNKIMDEIHNAIDMKITNKL